MKGKYEVIYSSLISEAESARNWPLKLLTFITVLYLAIITAHFYDEGLSLVNILWIQFLLITILVITYIWLTFLIIKYHLNYLKYRNIQIRINERIDTDNLLPEEFKKELEESICQNYSGWLFYFFYLTIIFFSALITILIK